jgi:glycolate oxidase iron-sulfur subunit
VCPSGVHFGRIMEAARAQLEEAAPRTPRQRLFHRMVLHWLLPNRRRLRILAGFLRVYQRSGFQKLARASNLLPRALRNADQLLPPLPRPFTPRFRIYAARSPTRFRVGLFTGCVMPLLYGHVHEATIRVLTWNGCEVHVPRDQTCCGALNVHAGERKLARRMAAQNVRAFLTRRLDAIVVNSAGCGSSMKEYCELLGGEESERFAHLTKDVNEFLASLDLKPPSRRVERVVTLQESCHLVHAQRVKDAPRRILAHIPGLELRDMAHPDLCCGSAGLYTLTQRDMSMRLLDDKMRDAHATGARTIATANPGCMLQLQAGLVRAGLRGDVKHIVELLDEAYGGPSVRGAS